MESAEQVGVEFAEVKLLEAQRKTWLAVEEVAARISVGNTEAEALAFLKESLQQLGYTKMWHPPQIRFGVNTLKPFAKPAEPGVTLAADDVFFLDIGPLFAGYEGDAGKTFAVGRNPELHRLAGDAKRVFDQVKAHWHHRQETGGALYEFARDCAKDLGWDLSLQGANGHRVSEFPHALHHKGKLQDFNKKPTANRWILEIHLISKSLNRGAFFEDLL
jgi:Xaa-Pro aminopeptidase